jgi:hypothetical protein
MHTCLNVCLYIYIYMHQICRPCHNAVHSFADENTLAESFNTLDKLMGQERIQAFVKYIAKRKYTSKRIQQTSSDRIAHMY